MCAKYQDVVASLNLPNATMRPNVWDKKRVSDLEAVKKTRRLPTVPVV